MKKFVKSIALICMLMFSISLVMAQEAKVRKVLTPEEMSQKQVERLKKQLSLSDEQAQKVKELITERNSKAQEVRKSNEGNKVAMRTAGREIKNNYETKLLLILTQEQKDTYNQIRENKKEQKLKSRVENK